jgi:hypothetical protein
MRQGEPFPEQPDDPDNNEAPETPTDEPPPVPIRDPPSDDTPKPPLTVAVGWLASSLVLYFTITVTYFRVRRRGPVPWL